MRWSLVGSRRSSRQKGEREVAEAIRFGQFELDLLAGEIRRRGTPIPLQPQPFKLLVLLAGRPGELVTREEIRGCLWGEETLVDYEQGIAYCVREVRRALGDSARAGRFVETVPGRGFRFLAETRSGSASRSRRSRLRAGWTVVAGVLIAALVATATMTTLWLAEKGPPRLAVLPFESLGQGAEGEMQARGLTEELIEWLGRRLKDRVDVLAPDSVYRQRDRSRDLSAAAEHLGADYLVQGTVRSSESGVRVAVRLIRPAGALTVWSREFDATLEDPVALQIRLGYEIGEALGWELLPERPPISTPETRRAVYEARAYLRLSTREGLEKARQVLEKALEREPNAGRLWKELGRVHWHLGESGQAIEALERATGLDPSLAEAYTDLAILQLYWEMDIPVADRLFQHALELNPSLAKAHQFRAFLLSALGRHQEALTAIARARSLDPLYEEVHSDSGWIHYFAHRFEEADSYCGESVAYARDSRWGHLCRVLARSAQGDPAGAWQAARAEMRALGFGRPDDPEVISLPADEALRRYWQWRLEWLESPDTPWASPCELATSHMELGETEAALADLEQAFEVERGWERLHLAQHPLYEPLHGDPRFQRLLLRLADAQNGLAPTASGDGLGRVSSR